MQFLFSPVQGALSDRFGRRPVILISNFGLGLDYILMALAPDLAWLFVGRVISGITAASISTAFAYIADVTPPEQRAARFGMHGRGVRRRLRHRSGARRTAGGSIDPRLPFWIAAAFSLLNGCTACFVLPESLPPDKRAAFSWRRANPLGSLVLLRSHPELLGLAGGEFPHLSRPCGAAERRGALSGYRYGWDERTVGLAMAVIGVCAMVVQGGTDAAGSVKRFGERAALMIGLLFGVAGFAVFGLAPTGGAVLPRHSAAGAVGARVAAVTRR